MGVGVVIEEAGAEIEVVTEVAREEKERWNEREENGNGDVVMNENGRTEDEEKGKENARGRKKWQENCGRRNVKLREREGMMGKRGVWRRKGGRKRKWKLKQDAKLTRIRIGQGKRKPREGMIPLTRILMNYLRKNLRREMILNHPKLKRKRNPLIQRARMIGRRNPERGAGRTVKMRMIVKRRR